MISIQIHPGTETDPPRSAESPRKNEFADYDAGRKRHSEKTEAVEQQKAKSLTKRIRNALKKLPTEQLLQSELFQRDEELTRSFQCDF
jgi:hypothetical protein